MQNKKTKKSSSVIKKPKKVSVSVKNKKIKKKITASSKKSTLKNKKVQTKSSNKNILKLAPKSKIKSRSAKSEKKRVVRRKRVNKNRNKNLTKIKVLGIGGCGGNIATRLYENFPRGVDIIVINTDLQDLEHCRANKKIYIGRQTTRGLGAGMDPEIGRQSAEENREEIAQAIDGADMLFITAGFGGGTGSGATPVVAEIAKEMGILTVAVITKPFSFEGVRRTQIANDAIEKLRNNIDTFIIVSNEKIFSVINSNTQISKAFSAIDDILKNAVIGVAEIILNPGIVNVDFADVKFVMEHSGPAIIGVGLGGGKDRALTAANSAINSPLLETSVNGSKGLLFSISGRRDLKMNEVNEIAKIVSENIDDSARIVFGTYHDRKLNKGQIKVTIIATGFDNTYKRSGMLFPDVEEFDGSIDDDDKTSSHLSIFDKIKDKNDEEDVVDDEKNNMDDTSVEEDVSIWEIPAFLRKKKKK